MSTASAKSMSWSGRDVFVCGLGARTAVGLDAVAAAAAVRAGISGVTIHPGFLDRADEPMAFAGDALLDERLGLPARMAAMLRSALNEATAAAGASRGQRRGAWLGLPEPRAGLDIDAVSTTCAQAFRSIEWPAPTVLPNGHAAGLMAIQAAAQAIARGEVDVALVAAVDSYQDAATLAALDRHGGLMSALNRGGFPPGEGAGACLLATRAEALAMGLAALGGVLAASTAVEDVPIHRTDAVCIGYGLTCVLKEVIATLDLPRDEITATYCDLNGQRYRSEEFVYALLRTQHAFVDAHDYLCPADCWGDVGAASGLLGVVLAFVAAQRGYSKGPRPLVWAGSESGWRCAVLLNVLPA